MKKLRATLFSMVLAGAVLGGGAYGVEWWQLRQYVITTDNAYVRGDITAISSRVDGYVEEVHVDGNQTVAAGEPLVTLRADRFETDVDEARADAGAAAAEVAIGRAAVDNARARRRLQQSLIAQADARLDAAKAQAEQAAREVERYRQLLERKTGSRQKYEAVATAQQTMEADVRRAQAELAAARDEVPVIDSEIHQLETEITRLEAKVARARSGLDRAEIALSDTVIVAPVAGKIGNQRVERGMYMEAGWPMMSVVPLDGTYVVANFKETQLQRLRIGQEAVMRVDAFPDHVLIGRIESLAPASAAEFSLLPAQNATGNFIKVVQRIPIKIVYDLPPELDGRVLPGMSVVVTVDTRSAPEGAALAGQ
ncbi:MAG TPA: HlyD family secretion protein [Alphaproteobacteria bacterium]